MSLKKIINYLLLLFIFLLPWQTRYIYHYGQLNGGSWEYGTLSLYGTEILLWFIVLLFGIRKFTNRELWRRLATKEHLAKNWPGLLAALMFLSFNAVVIINSLAWPISYQHGLWVLGGICLGLVIVMSSAELAGRLWLVLWVSGVGQALLAIWQFFAQRIYSCKWLGLASQDPSDAGVSVIQFADERWLRAYGSFGWPNSLGVYLAVCLVLGLVLFVKYYAAKRIWLILTIGQLIILFGLILSFSRGAWLAALAGIILLVGILLWQYTHQITTKLLMDNLFKQLLCYLVLALSCLILLAPLFVARFDLNNSVERVSVDEHKYQYVESMQVIYRNPLLGVGPGVYTLYLYKQEPNLKFWQYQPAHNIYILWLAETGLIGLLVYWFISLFLFKKIWQANRLFMPVIMVVLVHGVFDHWLWTLYGGVIFWWVIWALAFSRARPVDFEASEKTE